ncbi:AMP-binding enzyme [Burkholderia sp. D7]|nr:AMP-binding enzyme [Burkholderia sp. D7]
MALMQPITLAFVPKFSASRFWDEVAQYQATHLHFVGGVLPLLLKQPPTEADRRHQLKVAWGGGAPVEVWTEFQERFGVPVREGYGMTEAMGDFRGGSPQGQSPGPTRDPDGIIRARCRDGA